MGQRNDRKYLVFLSWMRSPWISIAWVILGFALDQWTKYIATYFIEYPIMVCDYMNWVLCCNRGAAFSLGSQLMGYERIVFSSIGCLAALWLIRWIMIAPSILCRNGLNLILSGNLGNLCDRLRHGCVVDFIDWHVGNVHWPAFNVADVWIFLGVCVVLYDQVLWKNKAPYHFSSCQSDGPSSASSMTRE